MLHVLVPNDCTVVVFCKISMAFISILYDLTEFFNINIYFLVLDCDIMQIGIMILLRILSQGKQPILHYQFICP